MLSKIISAGDLLAWIDRLTSYGDVYAPVGDKNISFFERINSGVMPDLKIRTDVPPKGLVFKQIEKILTYTMTEDGLEIEPAGEELSNAIIFGVRPCDARAFNILDAVLLNPYAPEHNYAAARERTILITLACNEPGQTCFCTSVGGSPAGKVGDVWMVDLGDRYYVEALTSAGGQAITLGENLLVDASEDDKLLVQQKARDLFEKVPRFPVPTADNLSGKFDDEDFWKSLADKCLSCGACTFLCPTCHCYEIKDEGNAKSGSRYRTWDSCMFSRFTRAAGGYNPRVEHWKRLRQRMMHKFSYFIENSGVIGCVGCGRCIRSCPVALDIREFLRDAIAAVSPQPIDFVGEPSGEGGKLRSCDIKTKEETYRAEVSLNDR